MQINRITPASSVNNVAGNTTFFVNTSIPAEQVLQKIVFPIGGQAVTVAGLTPVLPAVAQLALPAIDVGGIVPNKVLWRVVGSSGIVTAAGTNAVVAELIRSDVGPTVIQVNLATGTAAGPSVISGTGTGWAQADLNAAALAALAPAQAQTANFQLRLSTTVNNVSIQTIAGNASIELYLLAIPLQ